MDLDDHERHLKRRQEFRRERVHSVRAGALKRLKLPVGPLPLTWDEDREELLHSPGATLTALLCGLSVVLDETEYKLSINHELLVPKFKLDGDRTWKVLDISLREFVRLCADATTVEELTNLSHDVF